ncbi:MAG: hypothetical protein ACP5OP_04365 [Leptospirillia bacterium]
MKPSENQARRNPRGSASEDKTMVRDLSKDTSRSKTGRTKTWPMALLLSGILATGLAGCSAFTFNGHTFGGSDTQTQGATTPASDTEDMASPVIPPAFSSGEHLGKTEPLGLAPLGQDQSPRSQLMNEGTLGYVLDHLFGGTNPRISAPYLPPATYSTTTAGGVPGGLWPGNWWIEGQGGGYNLVHLP